MKRLATSLFALICLLPATHSASAKDARMSALRQNLFLFVKALDTRASTQTFFVATPSPQRRSARRKHSRRTPSRPKTASKPAGDGGSQPAQTPPPVRLEDSRTNAQPTRPPGKTDDELVAEAFSDALNDALRKPLAGETRASGALTHIECGAQGLVFVFKVGERTLRLSAKGFEGLHIMAFTNEAGTELSCGPRKRESRVVVTYRAAADARAKTDGALVALEFVPAGFQLKQ